MSPESTVSDGVSWPDTCETYLQALMHVMGAEPHRIALFDNASPVTADEFLNRVGIMALVIREALPDLDPACDQPTVGLLLHDNVWSMAAAIACWFLRCKPLLLDHRMSAEDLHGWITRCGLDLSVTRQKRLKDAHSSVRMIEDPSTLLADVSRVSEGRALLSLAGDRDGHATEIAEYLTSSGVSGPPKLYGITQATLLRNATAAGRQVQRGVWGTALCPISVVFGAARMIWWRNLLFGRTIHNKSLLFSIADLDRWLQDPQIDECTLPPHLIRALVERASREQGPVPRYPHLQKLQAAGGPALPDDKLAAQRMLSAGYVMTYSSTETGVIARIGGDDLRSRPASCGRPLPGLLVEIVDPDGDPLPALAIGRIRVSRSVPADSDEQSIYAFPGDLGWLDDDGFLYVAGRGEGIICRNGVNFAASVVEMKILQSRLVLDAAVLRIDREEGDDDLLIALHVAEDSEDEALSRALRRLLSVHEQPRAFVRVAARDLTPSGKIMRHKILSLYQTQPESLTRIRHDPIA